MAIFSRKNIRYCISYILLISLPFILIPEVAWMATQKQEQGEQLLEEGIKAFNDGDFDIALANLEKAVVLLQDKEKLADAHFYLSLVYFAFRRIDKVKENLTEMFKLNPEAEPDTELCAPEFLALWEEVKKGTFAVLIIETNPDKAEVYLDGELVGLTPLQLSEIAAREHKLKVTKEGYQPKEEIINLFAGVEKKLSFELNKKKPIVAVTPPEKKPEVKKSKVWLWILIGAAAAATAAILLTKKGGKETGTVEDFGSIQVKSYPAGASIFLDSNDTGYKTNHILNNIRVGSHHIILKLAGWKDWHGNVQVEKNKTAIVKPCLLPPNGCFRDNFQDGDADGWILDARIKIKKEGANYVLEGNGPGIVGCSEAYPYEGEWHNFNLKLRAKAIAFNEKALIIEFRSSSNGYYYINLFSDHFQIWKYTYSPLQHVVLGSSRYIRNLGEWFNVEIETKENNIKVFINGVLKINVNDSGSSLQKGRFKILYCTKLRAQVDDIVVISNECP